MDALIPFLIDWGYLGLFVAAFLAGSLLPFGSEAVLVALVAMGLSPLGALIAATLGNTLGGLTCYWIGRLGNRKWLLRLGIREHQLARAERFLAGRGAWMALFAFLPAIGEAIAVLLGMMRSQLFITALAMCLGKAARYAVILYIYIYIEQQLIAA